MDVAEGAKASDREAIEAKVSELRSIGFTGSRRGFDRDEVLDYLRELADWLEDSNLADPEQVRRELSLVGERTSEILTKAEETARELRAEAQRGAAETVDAARAEADRLTAEAEEDSRHARLEADAKAVEIVEQAERRAEQTSEEALRRRRASETLIEDLLGRRDEIVGEIQRLVIELSDVIEDAEELEAGDVIEAAGEPAVEELPDEDPAEDPERASSSAP